MENLGFGHETLVVLPSPHVSLSRALSLAKYGAPSAFQTFAFPAPLNPGRPKSEHYE